VDGCGPRRNLRRELPGRMDASGSLWTRLGDLRIKRLGVRVAPGAPHKDLVGAGFWLVRLRYLTIAFAVGAIPGSHSSTE
jgi:hypothetical protein